MSSLRNPGELVLEPIPRDEAPVPSFDVCDRSSGASYAITLVGSGAAVDRFIAETMPIRPADISIIPVGSTGGLLSHQWLSHGDLASAKAIVDAFNRATMGAVPFLGFATLCDLATSAMPLDSDDALDPSQLILTVSPLAVRTGGAQGTLQRVPRWQLPCWPAAVIESMPIDLRPVSAQLDVDAAGRVALAITPAAGRWIATRRWLTDNQLVVSGADRPPNGSWMLSIGVQSAGEGIHLVVNRAKRVIDGMPGLAGEPQKRTWGTPTTVGAALHIELETAPGWRPDPTLTAFDLYGAPGAPKVRVQLLRASTKVPPVAGPARNDAANRAAPADPQSTAQAGPLRIRTAWPALRPTILSRTPAAAGAARPVTASATATGAPAAAPSPPAAASGATVPSVAVRNILQKRRPAPAAPSGDAAAAAGPSAKVPRGTTPAAAVAAGAPARQMDVDAPALPAAPATVPARIRGHPLLVTDRNLWKTVSGAPDPDGAPATGSRSNWYAVARGRRVGVFDWWPLAWSMTDKWPNHHAGFDDFDEAVAFVRGAPAPKRTASRRSRSRSAAPATPAIQPRRARTVTLIADHIATPIIEGGAAPVSDAAPTAPPAVADHGATGPPAPTASD